MKPDFSRPVLPDNEIETFSEEQVAWLTDVLSKQGFVEPHPGWLTNRLNRVIAEHSIMEEGRDRHKSELHVERCEENIRAIERAGEYLDGSLELAMITGEVPDLLSMTDERAPPQCLQIVSTEEVESARKVLAILAARAAHRLSLAKSGHASRPIKNDRPEIGNTIRELALIWCRALGIEPKVLMISSSRGSPAMNFIEAASEFILRKPLERESIEKRIIAERARWRKAESDN